MQALVIILGAAGLVLGIRQHIVNKRRFGG